jgi:multicomponent Na+:H+ antiporter subunit E
MVILFNLLIATVLTWFTQAIYPDLPDTGIAILLHFAAWNTVLWLFTFFHNPRAFYKMPKIGALVLFYLKELAVASLRVAYEVLTPQSHMQPAVVAVPLEAKTDLEITLLANFITLTPGTLSIDVSADRKTLYVHGVYVAQGDTDKIKQQIKEGFEQKILKITRS